MAKPIATIDRPFITAEIGINHNGQVETAKRLIDMAADCGCNAVKFQKRTVDIVYDKDFLDSHRDSPWGTTQREQKEGLELGRADYDRIDKYCREKSIPWFASAWDENSQEFLRRYDLPYNKVASAMLNHTGLLEMIAKEGKHTFISCGMSDWEMVDRAVEVFRRYNCPFTPMHCVSTYPSDDDECNISLIGKLKERYGCEVGYSGHERGVLPSILAVAFGASVLERHITLDRALYGSDQAASLEHRGLELLVRDARRIASILGDGKKVMTERELSLTKKLRYYEA